MKNEKYAVCLGTYASCADRFITSGYHEELSFERIIEKVISTNGINGIEMDYPFMPPYGDDVSSLHKLKKILDNAGLKLAAIEIDHYSDTLWKFGALTSNDKTIRKKAIDRSKRGIDAAIELDTDQINLWFGQDGYDYPMEADYQSYWQYTIEGIQEIGEYREDIKVCIEYKPKEPRVHSLVSTVGKSLLVANATGLDNVGVNIDTGHALMAFENLADSAVLCNYFNKLFYFHLNDNYREWDHDLILGSVHLWESLELCYWLDIIGYEGWYSLDIYPYRQDAILAAEESIKTLKNIFKIARSINKDELNTLRKNNDVPSITRMLREATLK